MADARQLHVLFHGIGTPQRGLEPGEEEFWVDVDLFHRLLDEAMTWPGAVFSFDDGNMSDLEIGLPALLERGLVARFNVITDRLGQSGSLAETDVRELLAAGMAIGTHGMAHRSWRGLDEQAAHEELTTARQVLEELGGQPVTVAACPFGEYDRGALAQLRRAGYDVVLTSDRRPARPGHWLQPRYSVRGWDTPESMRREVLSLGPAQRVRRVAAGLVKRIR